MLVFKRVAKISPVFCPINTRPVRGSRVKVVGMLKEETPRGRRRRRIQLKGILHL